MSKRYGRQPTINETLEHFHSNGGGVVVELGSIRQRNNYAGDGYSTVAWAQHASVVYTVDINPKATTLTREETAEYDNVITVTMDGQKFLRAFDGTIDLLYLDAWDYDTVPDSAEQHLAAYKLAWPKMRATSLILIDDTDHTDGGKGKLAVPQAVEDGWKAVFVAKQTLLARGPAYDMS